MVDDLSRGHSQMNLPSTHVYKAKEHLMLSNLSSIRSQGTSDTLEIAEQEATCDCDCS